MATVEKRDEKTLEPPGEQKATQLKKNHLNYKPKVTRQTRRKLLGEPNDARSTRRNP